jgi:glycopeptide antibiotics resistance protein
VTGGAGLHVPLRTREQRKALRPCRGGGLGWLVVLFGVYLVLLVWIVLWKLEVPYIGGGGLRHIKVVPFVSAAEDGASEPLEVIANVVLFVPFGVYLGLIAPSWPWWRLGGVVAGTSLLFEVTQWVLSVGSCDITDLIVNTAGGLAGLGLLTLARRRLQDRTSTVVTRICAIGTVLFILAAAIFIASPLHYAPMQDVDTRLSVDLRPARSTPE